MIDRGIEPGDSELIAAFLDGRLSNSERREFLERLDRDEALYEVFAETVRYRQNHGGRRSGRASGIGRRGPRRP